MPSNSSARRPPKSMKSMFSVIQLRWRPHFGRQLGDSRHGSLLPRRISILLLFTCACLDGTTLESRECATRLGTPVCSTRTTLTIVVSVRRQHLLRGPSKGRCGDQGRRELPRSRSAGTSASITVSKEDRIRIPAGVDMAVGYGAVLREEVTLRRRVASGEQRKADLEDVTTMTWLCRPPNIDIASSERISCAACIIFVPGNLASAHFLDQGS